MSQSDQQLVRLLPDRPEELGEVAPTPAVFVIGSGVVGTALATQLSRTGVPVLGLHDRDPVAAQRACDTAGIVATTGELPDLLQLADVVVVAVQDDHLAEVARSLAATSLSPQAVILQTSGARPAGEALSPAAGKVSGLGTLHPLAAFAAVPTALARLQRGCSFAIEGDAQARTVAAALAGLLGGTAIQLDARSMALYHAGAVFASNYVVVLAQLASELLIRAGVPADGALPALLPLIESTVENLAAVGLPRALTGPVARGDVEPVRRHLDELNGRAPELVELYRRLGREALKLATRTRPLSPEQVRALDELLQG